MNKTIFIIIIGIIVILGAAFALKNFYAPSNERITFPVTSQNPPPQQLPTESTPSTSQGQEKKTTSPQVTPTPTPISPPSKQPIPINGTCGSSLNSCTQGTFQDVTDTGASYLWNCLGSDGGIAASCNLVKPPAASSNILDRIEAAIKEKLKK